MKCKVNRKRGIVLTQKHKDMAVAPRQKPGVEFHYSTHNEPKKSDHLVRNGVS